MTNTETTYRVRAGDDGRALFRTNHRDEAFAWAATYSQQGIGRAQVLDLDGKLAQFEDGDVRWCRSCLTCGRRIRQAGATLCTDCTEATCDHVGTERVTRTAHGFLNDAPAGTVETLCAACGSEVAV